MKRSNSTSKPHLDPEEVLTTVPPTTFPEIGDVVTNSPCLNDDEPDMLPEIDPSTFCFHLDSTGTPFGALDDVLGDSSCVSSCPKLKSPIEKVLLD